MREGGQHDQHFVKNKFGKNRVGGRGVNLNLYNVFKYAGGILDVTPNTDNWEEPTNFLINVEKHPSQSSFEKWKRATNIFAL